MRILRTCEIAFHIWAINSLIKGTFLKSRGRGGDKYDKQEVEHSHNDDEIIKDDNIKYEVISFVREDTILPPATQQLWILCILLV